MDVAEQTAVSTKDDPSRTRKRARKDTGCNGDCPANKKAARQDSIELTVTQDTITIAVVAEVQARRVSKATHALAQLQDAAAASRHEENVKLESSSFGTADGGLKFTASFTAAGGASSQMGMLASLADNTGEQRSSTRLRLPDKAKMPAWMLLNVLALQLRAGVSAGASFPLHTSLLHVRVRVSTML